MSHNLWQYDFLLIIFRDFSPSQWKTYILHKEKKTFFFYIKTFPRSKMDAYQIW